MNLITKLAEWLSIFIYQVLPVMTLLGGLTFELWSKWL